MVCPLKSSSDASRARVAVRQSIGGSNRSEAEQKRERPSEVCFLGLEWIERGRYANRKL